MTSMSYLSSLIGKHIEVFSLHCERGIYIDGILNNVDKIQESFYLTITRKSMAETTKDFVTIGPGIVVRIREMKKEEVNK